MCAHRKQEAFWDQKIRVDEIVVAIHEVDTSIAELEAAAD